ncbi:MAG TPA: DUF4957 domain-containing protein [Prolixibacteraceae bacterium]|nr:DUF4957 domain-containing protein [Prolixibacteraceae bacterium]
MRKRTCLAILLTALLAAMAVSFISCQEEETFPRTRLFMPVLNEDLRAEQNTIIVNMAKMKEAVSYKLEISRDTFKTIDYTVTVDTNYVVINKELVGEELLWFTMYWVRATAYANEPEFNSKTSDLGSVRTQKFPSNMGAPTQFDILDNQARVFWTPSGAAITHVRVYAITDVRLTTPLLTFGVTPEEQTAGETYINGLSPSTSYNIAVFSNETLRGWEIYNTKPPLVAGDNVINLSGIESATILADTLPDIPGGSIILLEGGRSYSTGGYSFDKSLTIMSGYSFVQALPHIDCTSNFNIMGNVRVDSIVFKNLSFSGAFDSRYVFNPNISDPFDVGKIHFEGCRISNLRGVARFRGPAPGMIQKFSMNNCVVDSIRDYAVVCTDTDNGVAVGDISLSNSTFSRCRYFLISRMQSNSVVIDNCTLSELPAKGAIAFRWRGPESNADITNGLTIRNTIWGHGWDEASAGGYDFRAHNGGISLAATTINVVNVYTTSQFLFTAGNELPGIPVGNYAGKGSDLWVNPYGGMDFHFKDIAFPGKSDCGDLRWRP